MANFKLTDIDLQQIAIIYDSGDFFRLQGRGEEEESATRPRSSQPDHSGQPQQGQGLGEPQ
eukprot:9927908-Lingulodinium_polyedra.AAC.1